MNKEEIDKNIVEQLVKDIPTILKEKSFCTIALAGGRSVGSIFDLLANAHLPWDKIHIFAVDDRFVPITHPDSNSGLIEKHLIEKIPIPKENFHPFDSTHMDEKTYSDELQKYRGYFDIILVSAGEDGHFAGLYPNHTSMQSQELGFVYYEDSPKPPPKRISATRKTLLQTKIAYMLFIGESKRDALKVFSNPQTNPLDCPSTLVKYMGKYHLYTDLQ